MKLIATENFLYRCAHVGAGEEIEVIESDGRLLLQMGRAKLAPTKAVSAETAAVVPVTETAEATKATKPTARPRARS
jgi:hypothetical protein